MTSTDIANHNELCIALTAADGIPRLSWEQHGTTFRQPVTDILAIGQQVAAYDSATLGTITGQGGNKYAVLFPDLGDRPVGGYSAAQLRPWPVAA